ncbi:MAG: hypothetical protein HUJ26_12385 [Planctomycetaceae bacterium]|nr:hypothetical protein [Planctomycetaceae bacterium]
MSTDLPESAPQGKTRAQKIFSRTNDLIAICIVLFAGLTMGESVLDWWNTSPEEAVSLDKNRLADDLGPPDFLAEDSVRIESGFFDVGFERFALTGTTEEVGEQMADRLSDSAKNVRVPTQEPTESERSLLKAIRDQKPVRTTASGVEIYFQDAPLAAFVAVDGNSEASENRSQNQEARVVSWGFVVPEGESRWTGWVFSPQGRSDSRESFDWKTILPEGAVCDLGFQTASDQNFLSFSGTGTLPQWRTEFENHLSRHQFILVEDWSANGPSSSAEFLRRTDSASQSLTIHIQIESQDRLRGILNVTRLREESP